VNPYEAPKTEAKPADADPDVPSSAAFWTGWVLTLLPAAGLILSGVMKFVQPGDPKDLAAGLDKIGWRVDQLMGLGIVELSCVAIYLFPRTAMLGAILITGYMGGAIATHVRVGDYGIIPHVILGVLVWLGLFLREPRLQRLVPWSR
jgi:hypothetical protein